ncbi:MAG: SDR family oxidoreductase [Gemmatimonadota bacterium]|nr:SDR family oxidoreductase [Gemmatimonadota bacterium]
MSRGGGRGPGAAVVTGASSGIGRELVDVLAGEGHDLVLVARSEGVLEELADEVSARHGAAARVVAMDLAERDAPARLERAVADLGVEPAILVNNAGFGLHGDFLDTDPYVERDMIDLNAGALTELTKRFGRGMAERGSGRILNVSSTAAFQPGPRMAVYFATKAYVLSFSLAVAEELEKAGVSVTTLAPGPTRTGFADRAGADRSRLFAGGRGMEPAAVARAGYEGLMAGERLVVPGAMNKLHVFLTRVVPRSLAARLAAVTTDRAR